MRGNIGKKLIVLLALVCVLAMLLTGCSAKIGEDIVVNGGFESYNEGESFPNDWKTFRELNTDESSSYYSFKRTPNAQGSDEFKERGGYSFTVTTSEKYTTAYFTQKVRLVSGKYYKLTYDINIESSIKGNYSSNDKFVGAYIGFLADETFIKNNNVKNATDGWQTREVYFQSKVGGKVELVAGLGHTEYGGARGSVSFDNIRVEAVNEVPPGITASVLKPGSSVPEGEVGGLTFTILGAFMTIALFFGAAIAIRVLLRKQGIGADIDAGREMLAERSANERIIDATVVVKSDKDSDMIDEADIVVDAQADSGKQSNFFRNTTAKTANFFKGMFKQKAYTSKSGEVVVQSPIARALTSPVALFLYVLLACFAVRFLFLMLFDGMADVLADMGKDALILADEGLDKFYSISSATYPSGMLYLLYAIGGIAGPSNLAADSVGMAMMLRIPNIIADVVVCYLIFILLNKHYSYKYSAVFAGVYALLPMMFTASGLWGMYISIGLAFIIGMIYCMLEKNYIGLCICYMFALLFSNIMFVFLPLFFGYFIYYCIKDKKAILPLVITTLVCFIVYYCLAIPFSISYFNSASPSVGVFMVFKKIYVDFNINVAISNNAFTFFTMLGLGGKVANSTIQIILAIVMAVFIVLGAFMFIKSKNRLDFLLLGALSAIIYTVFSVGSRIETMAVGIVLLFIYAAIRGERRLFVISAILSTLTFINMGILLTSSGYINFGADNLIGAAFVDLVASNATYIIGSIVTTLTTCYLIYVAYDVMFRGYQSDIKPMGDNWFLELKENTINKFSSIKNRFTKK